jgi:hypothetical protein
MDVWDAAYNWRLAMRVWFTTHWPHYEDTDPSEIHSGVWAKETDFDIIQEVEVGDLVWIYESATGKAQRRGSGVDTRTVRRRRGRGGVVVLSEVVAQAHQPEDSAREHYTDGSHRWWRYHAPTRVLNSAGFVPRALAATCLGYAPAYAFRGFGRRGSGIGQVADAAHRELLRVFTGAAPTLGPPSAPRRGPGGTGEGLEHKAIKEFIAHDPETALGEAGLRWRATEHRFATNDRADIVLEDQFGRLVGVEVEVDCGPDEIVGPLQCLKYRALLAGTAGRRVDEVRVILAARAVDPAVRSWCARYGVEVAEVVGAASHMRSARGKRRPDAV